MDVTHVTSLIPLSFTLLAAGNDSSSSSSGNSNTTNMTIWSYTDDPLLLHVPHNSLFLGLFLPPVVITLLQALIQLIYDYQLFGLSLYQHW
jgi:hypothetical protein